MGPRSACRILGYGASSRPVRVTDKSGRVAPGSAHALNDETSRTGGYRPRRARQSRAPGICSKACAGTQISQPPRPAITRIDPSAVSRLTINTPRPTARQPDSLPAQATTAERRMPGGQCHACQESSAAHARGSRAQTSEAPQSPVRRFRTGSCRRANRSKRIHGPASTASPASVASDLCR